MQLKFFNVFINYKSLLKFTIEIKQNAVNSTSWVKRSNMGERTDIERPHQGFEHLEHHLQLNV